MNCISSVDAPRRGSTRDGALQALAALLRQAVQEQACAANDATLTARCLVSLRKGSSQETALACNVLALHLVTLGEQSESRFSELRSALLRIAGRGDTLAERTAAIEAVAAACFVCSEHRGTTLEVMSALRGLWGSGGAAARAAAVTAWSFLCASVGVALPGAEVEGVLGQLSGMLADKSVDLRGAAGEAVALLYSACHLGSLLEEEGEEGEELSDESEEGDEAPNTLAEAAIDGVCMGPRAPPPAGAALQGVTGTPQAPVAPPSVATSSGLDDVVDRMKELASNRGDPSRRWAAQGGRGPGQPAACWLDGARFHSSSTSSAALLSI